jgi:hypothetical protein
MILKYRLHLPNRLCRYIFNGDFLMIFDIRYLAKHQWLAKASLYMNMHCVDPQKNQSILHNFITVIEHRFVFKIWNFLSSCSNINTKTKIISSEIFWWYLTFVIWQNISGWHNKWIYGHAFSLKMRYHGQILSSPFFSGFCYRWWIWMVMCLDTWNIAYSLPFERYSV